MSGDRGRIVLGILAILFYAVHGTYHVLQGFPENLLWTCHLGSLSVGIGLLARSPALNLAGIMWLSVGTPLWIYGLFGGSVFLWTSTLTHIGGPTVGLLGLRPVGLPARRVWWIAVTCLVPLHLLSRWMARPTPNVNFAGGIWPGMGPYFPSHTVFLLAVLLLCAGVFWGVEWAVRRLAPRWVRVGR